MMAVFIFLQRYGKTNLIKIGFFRKYRFFNKCSVLRVFIRELVTSNAAIISSPFTRAKVSSFSGNRRRRHHY